jgi:hypothetical protein
MHDEPGKAEYYRAVIKSIPEMFVFTKPNLDEPVPNKKSQTSKYK